MASLNNNGIISDKVFITNNNYYYKDVYDYFKLSQTSNSFLDFSYIDNATWGIIATHAYPTNYIFSSSDSFQTERIYKNNGWLFFYCNLLNKIKTGKYEFLIVQRGTQTSDIQRFRWIQFTNPMIATYSDVTKDKVIYNNSGCYTSIGSTWGGLYHSGSYTYLNGNNGTEGNWWGAIGAWTRHNNGIPGWNGTTITNGYLYLYVRIDDTFDDSGITSIYKNNYGINTKNIYEI